MIWTRGGPPKFDHHTPSRGSPVTGALRGGPSSLGGDVSMADRLTSVVASSHGDSAVLLQMDEPELDGQTSSFFSSTWPFSPQRQTGQIGRGALRQPSFGGSFGVPLQSSEWAPGSTTEAYRKMKRNFVLEMRQLSKLRHPCIISVCPRNPKPETRIPRPEIRNPDHETPNSKPETRNSDPETRNSKSCG